MTVTSQPETKSHSRRALLAGALGGIGAWAATAIGRASPVRAADDQPVLVGGEYTAESVTKFTTTTASALSGISGSATGVYGSSSSHVGVWALSGATNQPASLGWGDGHSTGVLGVSGTGDPPSAKAKTGVYGYAAQDNFSRGVIGESPAGIGVYGISTTGYGGYFAGRVYTNKWYELGEVANPAAPLANRARLYVRDSGGKTQLCVRFHTGAIKILAVES